MRVLILGAGGPVGIGWTRCLKDRYECFGYDEGVWSKKLMECEPGTLTIDYDCIIPSHLSFITRGFGGRNVMTIDRDLITLFDNKLSTALALGDMAPALIWERDYKECGGAQGSKMLSEYLPGDIHGIELVIRDGECIGSLVKQRVSYSAVRPEVCEITGSAMVVECVERPDLVELALSALACCNEDGLPTGIFTVDTRENRDGEPKVTEVNGAKFATSSFPLFEMYNLPLLAVETFLGQEPTPLGRYPAGYTVVRGADRVPWVGVL